MQASGKKKTHHTDPWGFPTNSAGRKREWGWRAQKLMASFGRRRDTRRPRRLEEWYSSSPRELRLPELPFVEVLGRSLQQPKRLEDLDNASLTSLYAQLDDAIEREAYSEAAALKARIDSFVEK